MTVMYVTLWPSSFILANASSDHSDNRERQSDAIYYQVLERYQHLRLTPVQLDFAVALKQMGRYRSTKQQQTVRDLQQLLASYRNNESLSVCQRITLAEISFQTNLAAKRLQLIESSSPQQPQYLGHFDSLKQGKQWYKHWLNSWLLADVDITTLKHMSFEELEEVKKQRSWLELQNRAVNNKRIAGDQTQPIERAFRQLENRVNNKVLAVLGSTFIANKLNIHRSRLPESFPAPGFYDEQSSTFYYHLQGKYLPEKHLPWLFLHEGIPGHHYLKEFAQQHQGCSTLDNLSRSTVFTEGWAAYVETLGEQFGVFQDKSSASYALDWQALRAVRVLIDIGIHYEGWTDEQARAFWMQHIPEQKSIMSREIKRIKNWPVQVITYVFGKKLIEKTITAIMATNPQHSKAEIHSFIMSLAHLSPASSHLWPELFDEYRQKKRVP